MVFSINEFEDAVSDLNEREISVLTSHLRQFHEKTLVTEKIPIAIRMERVAALFLEQRNYKFPRELSHAEKTIQLLSLQLRNFIQEKKKICPLM